MKLWNYIKENMLRNPNQIITEDGAALSFEDAVIWAELFANKLAGIKCCAILCRSEMASAMALLGCFAAEVTAVPMSMRYGFAHCQKILDTISPDAIISDENGELKIQRIEDSSYIEPSVHPVLIMCTSGTTGAPKGIMLSDNNIISNVSDITSYFTINNTDTILISRPLYHCAVLSGEFITALVKGTKIRFYSEKFNPAKILKLIQEFNITAFCGTPTLLNAMAKFKRSGEETSLKYICVSGECLDKSVGQNIMEAFPDSYIYHVYGLTEASPRVAYLPPLLFKRYTEYVGVKLKSVSIKILDEKGQPCENGKEGILWVKGNNVMIGYYNDPIKTSNTIKDGWLCTGDIAVFGKFGLLQIKGRCDDLIIKAGMNIYPSEIESTLKREPKVYNALIYGYKNHLGTTQIGLKIVGDFSNIEEIKKLCQDCLPPFHMPSKIEVVDDIPQNGSGKIIRRV